MKNFLMLLPEKTLFRKRVLIKSVTDELKTFARWITLVKEASKGILSICYPDWLHILAYQRNHLLTWK